MGYSLSHALTTPARETQMQVTIKGHVYAKEKYGAPGQYRFSFYGCKNDHLGMYVGPHEVTYDVPADWNPVAAEVATLEAQKRQALEDFQNTVAKINERLSKLQAIAKEAEA